jgi:hypothetical protein
LRMFWKYLYTWSVGGVTDNPFHRLLATILVALISTFLRTIPGTVNAKMDISYPWYIIYTKCKILMELKACIVVDNV